MAFLHSVIGDNTIENREHLEKVGYTPLKFCVNGKYLYARSCTWANKNRTWQEPYFATDNNIDNSPKYINCIGNPQLFKAVSAMRDDSDIHQVFFIEGLGCKDDYWLCDTEKFNHESENLPFDVYAYSKCDLSELQAHFQRV